jgi:hypothetical protein
MTHRGAEAKAARNRARIVAAILAQWQSERTIRVETVVRVTGLSGHTVANHWDAALAEARLTYAPLEVAAAREVAA